MRGMTSSLKSRLNRARIRLIFAFCLAFLLLLTGCAKEISREPMMKRFISEHTDIYPSVIMVPNGRGGMRQQPILRSVHHADDYQILYRVEYDNGKTVDRWVSVTKSAFDECEVEEICEKP